MSRSRTRAATRRLRPAVATLPLALGVLITINHASPACSQQVSSKDVPSRRTTDARGVDLSSGDMRIRVPLVSFGSGATALNASLDLSPLDSSRSANDFANMAGTILGAALRPHAQLKPVHSEQETGDYENVEFPMGSGFFQQPYAATVVGGDLYNVHTNPDGSQYTQSFGATHFTRFITSNANLAGVYDAEGNKGVAGLSYTDGALNQVELQDKIVFANGEEWRFYREFATVSCTLTFVCRTTTITRLRFIVSSRGYGIQFLYTSDATPTSDTTAGSWYGPRRVTGYNKAAVFCDESALTECPAVSALPSATMTYNSGAGTVTVVPPSGKGTVELTLNGTVTSFRRPDVPNSIVSFIVGVDQTDSPYIQRVTDANGQSNYSRIVYVDDSGHIPLMNETSTNPAGGQVMIQGYAPYGEVQMFGDELNRYYNYGTGYPYRFWDVSGPEGNDDWVSRDRRNNVLAYMRGAKPNSQLPDQAILTASYPVDCINPKTCNHPTWVRDGNGNQTDFTYAPEHGGVLTETAPAVNGVRAQKRYTYQQRYAWISNGSGGYVHATAPVWLLTQTSFCKAGNPASSDTGCANGSSDEVVTTYDYGPDVGPNTLLLRGTVVDAGGLSLRTCYGYDAQGNKISETKPRAGLAGCS